uniref:RNA-directed DNA polymerase, eukaryota, reverse transcriptase zinc-binding domain protein n=1 Tax=Tanacetum cinerariifolium TaxID=118510 RepID=A0A6L2LXR6_TANCI|nr:RNA-directed DNA polymerase, eukaryota, reverse transcriptase zinc-binding domain protein [Tanacetum cinerariifolium]
MEDPHLDRLTFWVLDGFEGNMCVDLTGIIVRLYVVRFRRILVRSHFGSITLGLASRGDAMVEQTWRSFSHNDANRTIRFKKKKIQDLKVRIRAWIKDKRSSVSGEKDFIKKELIDIDRLLDGGDKSKIKWAIEGDENSKFFQGLINKKRSQLAIREIFVDGIWCTNLNKVNEAFFKLFEARFKKPVNHRLKINFLFSKRLSDVQASDLERRVSRDEIRLAVWNCGENKSPGPDGYSFEFLRKYWNLVGSDLCGFKGVHLRGSTSISHLFYAYDVMFIGEWSDDNLKGGRLTILKAVLGASPLYNMSIFKVPKGILKSMEAILIKALLEGVFYVAWWSVWGFKNRTISNEMPPRRSVLFDDIVSLSFNWFSSRCNRAITWDSWLKNPHLISL